jgi:peptidoglycan/xylan/chitin deacetylase (PgdA/CDA1 family)
MIVIVVGLGVSVTRFGEQQPAEPPPPASGQNGAGPSGALAQVASPSATLQTATAVPTPTETHTPSPTPTASPTVTPSALPTLTSTQKPTEDPEATSETIMTQSLTETRTPTATPMPLPTPREAYSWTLKVPILMYHYISEPPEDADKYRLDLSTSPALFREQMQYLVDNGFETVDLYDLSLAITDKIELPAKPIIITLDDGYRDNYENAFPILQEMGQKATFFVTTEFVDLMNPDYMDWAMVEEMAAAGMRVEPHSKTHPDLTKETIAGHTGFRPRYFAYPGGRYNDEVIAIVSELDFWGAVTTDSGLWHGFEDRFEWGRLRMRNTTSVAELAGIIE